MAVLVPCLVQLRSEINALAPDRDKASDGWIGDQAHADRVSSHNADETGAVPVRDADRVNEVHAYDVDKDLRVPHLGLEEVVQHVLRRCRAGQERRLRNIIFNRRIWAASDGWRQRPYTGPNAHDQHAHFEASYDPALEASTASWRLEEIPVALTAGDRNHVDAQIEASEKRILAAITKLVAGEKPSKDGEVENPIGRAAFTQPVPNPLRGDDVRTDVWVLLEDMANALVKLLNAPPG